MQRIFSERRLASLSRTIRTSWTNSLNRTLLTSRPIYLLDNFIDSDSTAISSHTPDTLFFSGYTQTASNSFYIQSNQLTPNRFTDNDKAVIDTGMSDFTIESVVVPFSDANTAAFPAIVFRYLNATNYWYVYADSKNFNGQIVLYTVENGTSLEQIQYLYPMSSLQSISLRIDCSGPMVTLWVDGNEIVSYKNNFNRYATFVGYRCGKSGAPGTKQVWKSMSVSEYKGTKINWPFFIEQTPVTPAVVLGTAGQWDDGDVNDPNVFYDTINSRWVMAYSGHKSGVNLDQGIGIAYATNIEGPWTKEVTNPVFFLANQPNGINGGFVKFGSLWYYYYGLTVNNKGVIGCVTSPDLLNWTDHGVVLSCGNAGQWDSAIVADAFARITQDGTTVQLWYTATDVSIRSIGLATSTDGLTFTKNSNNPVLHAFNGNGTSGEPAVWCPSGKEGKEYLVAYDNEIPSSSLRSITIAATFDNMKTWRHLTRALNYGTGWESSQVFDSYIVSNNNNLYLFHGGSDTAGVGLNINIQIGIAKTVNYDISTLGR